MKYRWSRRKSSFTVARFTVAVIAPYRTVRFPSLWLLVFAMPSTVPLQPR
ncbi:MAG: hypothetical protein M5R40_06580 [Anaerolineae bacterium]|nr:hypothetical protein [Anaerolineae bacterium]